jgi:hypothetical protein
MEDALVFEDEPQSSRKITLSDVETLRTIAQRYGEEKKWDLAVSAWHGVVQVQNKAKTQQKIFDIFMLLKMFLKTKKKKKKREKKCCNLTILQSTRQVWEVSAARCLKTICCRKTETFTKKPLSSLLKRSKYRFLTNLFIFLTICLFLFLCHIVRFLIRFWFCI